MTKIALAVVHDRSADRVLLIRRLDNSDMEGWAFPGGKVEAADGPPAESETICRAARRELVEETGIAVNGGKALLTRTHPRTGAVVTYVYFSEEDLGTGTPQPRRMEPAKADRCAWMPRAKVEELFDRGFSQLVLHKMDAEACRAKSGNKGKHVAA